MKGYIPKGPLNVAHIGLGGIGQELLPKVARVLNYAFPSSTIRAYDGDSAETKNLLRQEVIPGENKAVTAVQRLSAMFKNVIFHAEPHYVSAEAASQIMAWAHVILVSPDNDKTRGLFLRPWPTLVESGLLVVMGCDPVDHQRGRTGALGSVFFHERFAGVSLHNDWFVFHELQDDMLPSEHGKEPGCAENVHTQLFATNQAVALAAFLGVVAFLEGRPVPEEIYVDSLSGNVVSVHRPLVEEEEGSR